MKAVGGHGFTEDCISMTFWLVWTNGFIFWVELEVLSKLALKSITVDIECYSLFRK